MLYELENDPRELYNLAAAQEEQAGHDEHRQHLHRMLATTATAQHRRAPFGK